MHVNSLPLPIYSMQDWPLAYSYVRFSSAKQELGDSLRRQVALAEKYCKDHNLNLQDVSYRDLGVSAFRRKNLERGALNAFIVAVEKGTIARGSFLILEQFDRMSRADISVAMGLLLRLVALGITVVTVKDGKIWDSETVTVMENLLIAIIYMSRANLESADKGGRVETAWDQKKIRALETGEILTRECPRWLEVSEDRKSFIVLEDRVESIKKVFAMRNGGRGAVYIVSRANEQGWPVPGKGTVWHTSLVGRLLKNRALLGEYQPHKNIEGARAAAIAMGKSPVELPKNLGADAPPVPYGDLVPAYYPRVMDEATFLGPAAVALRRGRFPGRRDVNSRNFLQGLLRCTCGASFVRKNKTSLKQPGYARYYCVSRNRGVTDCPSVGAREIESAIIYAVVNTVPQYFDGANRVAALKSQTDILRIDFAAATDRRDRFADAIGESGGATVASLMLRLNAAQAAVDEIEKALAAAAAEAADLGSDSASIFSNIAEAIRNPDSVDARSELRENLARVLSKCVVDTRAVPSTVALHIRGRDETVIRELDDLAAIHHAFAIPLLNEMTDETYYKMMCDEGVTAEDARAAVEARTPRLPAHPDTLH